MNSKSNNSLALLEAEIHQAIPISKAMNFSISKLTELEIEVKGPLAVNINIHQTGFAGSIYSLASLAVWGILRHIILSNSIDASHVIKEANISYQKPIKDEEIICRATITQDQLAEFKNDILLEKKARLTIRVHCGEQDQVVAEFKMVAFL